VGRLPVVATLEELDEEALIKILTLPKNALSKQYSSKGYFNSDDAQVILMDGDLGRRKLKLEENVRSLESNPQSFSRKNILDSIFTLQRIEDLR